MIVERLGTVYDIVFIGSGFGGLFFLKGFLKKFPHMKVAIIERGKFRKHEWQTTKNRSSDFSSSDMHGVRPGEKPWNYTIGLGGGMNCWWGQTPRFLPSDFQTFSRFGVGIDWPITYDELEPFYLEAERIMSISGGDAMASILPRSGPFPQPPHRFSSVDRIMADAQPEMHVPIATARARVATDERNSCCASARCNICPVDAKFNAENGFADLIDHPSVHIVLEKEVRYIEYGRDTVTSVLIRGSDGESRVSGDLFVLGANAIHSPAILLRSGLTDQWLGRGLHEQHSVSYEVHLDGVKNFDGSTVTTGLNYSICDGDFRRYHGGSLIYFENRWSNGFRQEKGRWLETLPIWVSIEDLPDFERRVTLDAHEEPLIIHPEVSQYALKGAEYARQKLPDILAPLPVEEIFEVGVVPTASHIQGTTRFGSEVSESVVDKNLVHHRLRNLIVVGSSVLPTSSCANPSLTAAALSLWSAQAV